MKIIINGIQHNFDNISLTYKDLITKAGFEENRIISVTYQSKRIGDIQRSGILNPGTYVEIEDGMVFNAYDTSKA